MKWLMKSIYSLYDSNTTGNSRLSGPVTLLEDSKTVCLDTEHSVDGARAQNHQDARARYEQSDPLFASPNTNAISPSQFTRAAPSAQSRRSELNQNYDMRPNSQDTVRSWSKKGISVEYYFKQGIFTEAPELSFSNLIRDYEICVVEQSLTTEQKSLFFVNTLVDPARQFFLIKCSLDMPYEQVSSVMLRQYGSETSMLQLESEIGVLHLSASMEKK